MRFSLGQSTIRPQTLLVIVGGSVVATLLAGWAWSMFPAFGWAILLTCSLLTAFFGFFVGQLARSSQANVKLPAETEKSSGKPISKISSDELEILLDAVPSAIAGIAADQSVRYVNLAFAHLLETTKSNIVGKRLWEVHRIPGLIDAWTRAESSDYHHDAEFEVLAQRRAIKFHARPTPKPSPIVCLLFLEDVSELRRLQQLRNEFFANVGHELKTPLAAIKGYTDTILEYPTDQETVQKFVSKIAGKADQLHSLILDMLALARVESTAAGYDIQRVDLPKILRQSADSFDAQVRQKSLRMKVEINAEDVLVLADTEALDVVFRNLIDNAIKYTPTGGEVSISLRAQNGQALVEVSDTGIGIPEKDLPRVFERFFRVDKARSRVIGGTGLGLAIAKQLVDSFQGEIAVSSKLNRGSTFSVRFPIASVVDELPLLEVSTPPTDKNIAIARNDESAPAPEVDRQALPSRAG